MNTIHDALLDAKNRKPGLAKFAISLIPPTGLVAKGLWDISRLIASNSTVKIGAMDWSIFAPPAIAVLGGLLIFGALLVQLLNDRKPSRTLDRALEYVDGWRLTLPADSATKQPTRKPSL